MTMMERIHAPQGALTDGEREGATRVYTVAKDGRSMTETIIWASGGIPALETTYFNRAG